MNYDTKFLLFLCANGFPNGKSLFATYNGVRRDSVKIAVICSDERMIQVYDNLSRDFMVDRLDAQTDFLNLPQYQAVVFPVKGVDEFGYVRIQEQAIHIPHAFYEMQGKDCLLFCGIRNAVLDALPQRKIYYMLEESVIHENAVLTAEGVLNELISCICKSIYDIQVDIVGYGHCGQVIYDMLKNLHVRVRIIRRDCKKEGNFLPVRDWETCGDVIIHTATGVMIAPSRMRSWKNKPVIIDISTPDLIDLKAAHEEGITVIKAGNLPGRFACISAGNIIAECIRGKLNNGK